MSRTPTIREFRVRAVRVPMAVPHRTTGSAVSESPLVLTDAIADEGVADHSMIFTDTPAAFEPAAELIQNIAAMVIGDPLAPPTAKWIEGKGKVLVRPLGDDLAVLGVIPLAIVA